MGIATGIRGQMQEGAWVRRMFEEARQLRRLHGEDRVFDLSLGNPLLGPPPRVVEALRRVAVEEADGCHRYMPNGGFPDVREAIAKTLGHDSGTRFGAGDVLMSVGAAGGINVFLHAILDPGDEVVVLAPYFAEYLFYVRNHAGVVRVAQCGAGFLPDLRSLRASLSSRTRAVIINTPNNPTGVIYPEPALQGVADAVAEAEQRFGSEIYLLSDEPYRKLVYAAEPVPYIYGFHPRSVSVTSYSKDLGLAGERIGYIAVNPADPAREDLIDAMTFATRTLGFVNAPAIMQRVVAAAGDATVDIRRYQKKRDRLYDALREIGYECVKPEGAFYLFPRAPMPDDVAFVRLLQSKLVLTVPGAGFGLPGYFRASFSVEDPVIEGALPAFEAAFCEARRLHAG